MQGFAAHLIRHGIRRDTFSSRRRLGRCRASATNCNLLHRGCEPGGGAVEKDDYPSVSFADSSPDKGSLGALPRHSNSTAN